MESSKHMHRTPTVMAIYIILFLYGISWAGGGRYDVPWGDSSCEKNLKPFLVSKLGGENIRIINDGDINNDGMREIVAVRPLGHPWVSDSEIYEETVTSGIILQVDKASKPTDILLAFDEMEVSGNKGLVFLQKGSMEWVFIMTQTGFRLAMISVEKKTISDNLNFEWEAEAGQYFLVTYDLPPGKSEGIEMVPFYGVPKE